MTSGMRFPPFARPGRRVSTPTAAAQVAETLPSIDEFVDELPAIEDFLADQPPAIPVADSWEEPSPQSTPQVSAPAEGWAAGEWQSYNWDSLSALKRDNPRQSAAESWGDSDWPLDETDSRNALGNSITPGADEIANALDGIARRIRSGELVIDNLHGTPPEAAMAAAIAVLLRMRG
jgi:hypothetical protein